MPLQFLGGGHHIDQAGHLLPLAVLVTLRLGQGGALVQGLVDHQLQRVGIDVEGKQVVAGLVGVV